MRFRGDEHKSEREQHYKNKAAYIMGQESKKEGLELKDNPFESVSEEYREWEKGHKSSNIVA